MEISYPNSFYCYDEFSDISDEVIEGMINELLIKMQNDNNMSVAIKNLGNTEVIVFKQYRQSIDSMAYRVIVMKDFYEKIIELDEEEALIFYNKEDAKASGCLKCD